MKHFNKLFIAVMMVMALSSHSQNDNNPWALSFGVNAVDTRTSAGGGKNWLDKHFSQIFNVSENWNILPSVSYLSVARSVGDNFSVVLQGSVNKIDKFVVFDPTAPDHNGAGYVVTNPGGLMYYGIDASVKYSFMSLIKSKVIDPSLHIGGGYTFFGDNSYGTVNPGAGLTFWFNENVGLALATTYKWTIADKSSSVDRYTPESPSVFQHTAGITFQFGGKDTDGDGIYDKNDACPEVAGLKQFNGCPDTDGDGIIDGSDACPDVFGLAALNGCPDTDGDGIADKDDACPNVAGLAAFKGCPDTDKDGIADKDDKCPTVAGPKENGGCPILDADKDGVPDSQDDCPTVAGPASNKGCPEVIESLKIQARSVFFDKNKSTFKSGDADTIASLDAMREILRNYPNTKFSIEGNTDSDGSNAFNQKLSEDRANAVRNALIEKGVKPENLVVVGVGETKPIASNKTKEGKAQNRRTEVRHEGK
jgi:outer membrane protein OmpA-like peptidoglycan-associated protein